MECPFCGREVKVVERTGKLARHGHNAGLGSGGGGCHGWRVTVAELPEALRRKAAELRAYAVTARSAFYAKRAIETAERYERKAGLLDIAASASAT